MPHWASIAWNIGLACLAFVVGAAKTLDDQLTAETWKWVHSPKLQACLAIALAGIVLLDSIRRAIGHLGAWQEVKMRSEVRKQLSSAIATVCAVAGVKPGDVGSGLFLVHRSRRKGLRLKRVERVRLLDTMTESGIVFRENVGTVGKCWATERPSHHNWTAVNRRHAEKPPDEAAWNSVKSETKHGFTYSEWLKMLGRYSEVIAVPVTVNAKLIGCLAVDLRWHAGEASASVLNTMAVRESLGGFSRALEPVLAGK